MMIRTKTTAPLTPTASSKPCGIVWSHNDYSIVIWPCIWHVSYKWLFNNDAVYTAPDVNIDLRTYAILPHHFKQVFFSTMPMWMAKYIKTIEKTKASQPPPKKKAHNICKKWKYGDMKSVWKCSPTIWNMPRNGQSSVRRCCQYRFVCAIYNMRYHKI